MSSPIFLNNLEIKNFRAFRHLRIERLGRVNLIVGKNNVGKTCLLEALWLYAHRGDPRLITSLLETRDEADFASGRLPEEFIRLPVPEEVEHQAFALKYLFYGRRDLHQITGPIQIGPLNSSDKALSIEIKLPDSEKSLLDREYVPLLIRWEGTNTNAKPLEFYTRRRWQRLNSLDSDFIPANGLGEKQTVGLWDHVALTDWQEEVLNSLQLIAPAVERINFVGVPEGQRPTRRIPIVRLAGQSEPIPLRSLGEGMNRILGLALAMVNARGGLLLIDEVDSGLHYTVQPDIWRLIFETARRLNMQVFATTHSWDCLEAFQEAATADEQAEGLLISLRRKQEQPEDIVAVLFDEAELKVAARAQIEVR